MRKNKKIGILGGTFNPVHNGHIDLGLRVKTHFGLHSIRYILSAKPPHKEGNAVAPVPLRWEMLRLGLKPYPGLIPDDIEIKRGDYSWTIDTVRELTSLYPDSHLYFISGSEGFLKIPTWKNYKKLFEMINFIVVLRSPDHAIQVSALLESEGITAVPQGGPEDENPSVYFFSYESEFLGLSSTKIRGMRREGRKLDRFVNIKVKEIIEENDLYGKNQS
jgi:nicotinate-nucleotide adenylyltransferase